MLGGGKRESTFDLQTNEGPLLAKLSIPAAATALVLLAQSDGSSSIYERNSFVAGQLNKAGLATLTLNLLSGPEAAVDLSTLHFRFDITLLSRRILFAIRWLNSNSETQALPVGVFAHGTGSAAAIVAAVEGCPKIVTIASVGSRPDLAAAYLPLLETPTLLLVAEHDEQGLTVSEAAINKMHCQHKLEIVSCATPFFEDPDSLERLTELTRKWFLRFMTPPNKHLNALMTPTWPGSSWRQSRLLGGAVEPPVW